jgi:DNA processing protein
MIYWIWLSQLEGIGSCTQKLLLQYFQTPERIYHAKLDELLECNGIGKERAEQLLSSRSLEKVKRILEQCDKHNIALLTCEDHRYPELAKAIPDMPILLYYKGQLIPNTIGIGIVGSRRCSDYGKGVTVDCATYLARHSIPVISGTAKGIDSYAHTACLKAGGYTVAVMGNGLDICYPSEHRSLMEQITEYGLLLSEYEPGRRPNRHHFPKRNRIISAWSQKLLVVEAVTRSGSLITAEAAWRQGREVLAVPGRLDAPESAGSNGLIAQGASIFLHREQLLPEKSIQDPLSQDQVPVHHRSVKMSPRTKEEKDFLQLIQNVSGSMPVSIEQIVNKQRFSQEEVLEMLLVLELQDVVAIHGDKVQLL